MPFRPTPMRRDRRPSPWALARRRVGRRSSWAARSSSASGGWPTSEKRIATYSVTRRGEPDHARPRRRERGRRRRRVGAGGPGAAHRQLLLRPPRGRADRAVSDGELRLRSRCPVTVLASCSASYRVRVPDNIPVTVRTSSGDVRFSAYRGSASIDDDDRRHLGRRLLRVPPAGARRERQRPARARRARRSGSCCARARATSARSSPPGRYRVDADTDGGSAARRRADARPRTRRSRSRR